MIRLPRRTKDNDTDRGTDRRLVEQLGPVAPSLGWRTAGAGRAVWAKPARTYVATTTSAAGLFPFTAGSGAPTSGVPLGKHLLWGEVVCCDPFSWLADGLVSNTGMWILGQPGVGKSSLAKRLTIGMAGFGVKPLILGDTKGEHTPVIEALGGQVVRVGRGLDRINPLDSGPLGQVLHRLPAADAEAAALEVRGRRLTSLLALASLVRGPKGAPVSNGEEVLLGRAVDLLSADPRRPAGADPTIADVLTLLRESPQPILDAAEARTRKEYEDASRELRRTLNLLLEGPLKGVFDGATTTPLDLSAPGVSIDISATGASGDTLVAAAMLSTWAFAYASVDAAHLLADHGLAPPQRHLMVLDELWRALRGSAGLVEHADSLTRLNRSRGIASLMISHSLADLEALPTAEDVAKARGFVERAAIIALGGLPPRELRQVSEVVPLTGAEQYLVSGWASADSWQSGAKHPGRGRYLLKTGQRPGLPLSMTLTPQEIGMYDTDARSRQAQSPQPAVQIPGQTTIEDFLEDPS